MTMPLERAVVDEGGGLLAPGRNPLLGFQAIAAGAIAIALLGTILWRPRPALVWNASTSSRPGLYLVEPSGHPRPGEMVVAWPPARARQLAAARRYLPANVPLVKPVAATGGERVCARGSQILIDGRIAATRLLRDRRGRPMPWWSGCHFLRPDELFLLSAHVSDAFDGRYFGTSSKRELVGRARLVWPR